MIRLTCPECHSRCRLKSDTSNHNFSYGRCPVCGHRFPLLPAGDQQMNLPARPIKNGTENQKQWRKNKKELNIKMIMELIRNPLFIAVGGLILVLLLLTISLSPNQKVSSTTEKISPTITIPKNQTSTDQGNLHPLMLKPAKLYIDPTAGTQAIAQIKHHALVADADINIHNQQLQLTLLVSDKTPASYSERLGCQFAHYVKELIQKEQHPTFLVSVYYPDGTRIEVTVNDQFLEEEVIQKMENEE